LPTSFADVSREEVLARLALDKKRAGTRQRWVLAERVGSARIRDDVPADTVEAALDWVTRRPPV
jgi:3-dehydroquinate synthetase